jgi:hypothetical protein
MGVYLSSVCVVLVETTCGNGRRKRQNKADKERNAKHNQFHWVFPFQCGAPSAVRFNNA